MRQNPIDVGYLNGALSIRSQNQVLALNSCRVLELFILKQYELVFGLCRNLSQQCSVPFRLAPRELAKLWIGPLMYYLQFELLLGKASNPSP